MRLLQTFQGKLYAIAHLNVARPQRAHDFKGDHRLAVVQGDRAALGDRIPYVRNLI